MNPTLFMLSAFAISGAALFAMLIAAIWYLRLGLEARRELLPDDRRPGDLSRGERLLQWATMLGFACVMMTIPAMPRHRSGYRIDVVHMPIVWGFVALSCVAIGAVLLRRLIYKRIH